MDGEHPETDPFFNLAQTELTRLYCLVNRAVSRSPYRGVL